MQSVAAGPTPSTTPRVLFPPTKSAGSLLIYLPYPVSPSPSDCPHPPALASLLPLSLFNHSLPPSLFFYLSICILFSAAGCINYSRLLRGPSDYAAITKSYQGRRVTPVHITHAPPNTTLMATDGTLPSRRGRLLQERSLGSSSSIFPTFPRINLNIPG